MSWIPYLYTFIFVLSIHTNNAQESTVPISRTKSFGLGEELDYQIRYSVFNIGKAKVHIDREYHEIDSILCYKVVAKAKTSDWVSWITKFDDNWGAYLDTATLLPEFSYRTLSEGKYYIDELVTFNHETNEVTVKAKKDIANEYVTNSYVVPEATKDIIAGFFYLRTIDFNQVMTGDTITIPSFLEDQTYNMKMIFEGREIINTSFGKVPSLRLKPIVPNNSLFDGENSVLCWISDDRNRIPLRIRAKMFIGNAAMDLIKFRNLRNQIKVIR